MKTINKFKSIVSLVACSKPTLWGGLVGLFLLTGLCSCGNDNDTPEINDGRVQFSSGSVATPQQRIGGTDGDQWEGTEKIGIYMVGNGNTTVAEGAENIMYSTASTGASATFTSATPIYYPVDATQKVDFIAYHPHATTVSNYVYQVDTKTQSDQSAIDLMRAKANNGGTGYDKTQAASYVNLTFDHKLTKLIFKTTPDAGLTQGDLATMTVTIKGLNTKATYDISSDALGTPATPDAIVLKSVTAGKVYEGIVVPQSFAIGAVTVEFALNNAKNEVFVWNVPATVFASAEKHIFDVKVQRLGVQVRGTINAWQSVGVVSGIAN